MFERVYFILGLLIFLIPIIGVWSGWKEWGVAVIGLLILILSTASMLSDKARDDSNKDAK